MDRDMIKNVRREITPYLKDLCRDLIRIPSQSGKEGNLADLVKKRMIEFGYDKVSVDNLGNVVGIKNGLKSRPLLLFDGHMDTVPPGNRRLWREDPFSGRISKGSIFGRGAIDMKSALAAMILIPHTLKVLGSKLRARLATALVVLEEPCEGLGMRNIIEKGGLIPDAVVLGEPSNLALAIGHRGRFEIKVSTYGKTCHSSMPERGINAINKMLPILRRVEILNRRLSTHHTLGRATITSFKITSSPIIGNLIPDICEIILDRRTLPGETKSQILRECKESILSETNRSKVSIYKMELETYTGKKLKVEQTFPYWILPKSHWLTNLVKESVRSVGLKPVIRTWRFGTDGSYTAGVKKIPTIGFGPGEPERAHTPNESVPISDVVTAALVYAQIAQNWA